MVIHCNIGPISYRLPENWRHLSKNETFSYPLNLIAAVEGVTPGILLRRFGSKN